MGLAATIELPVKHRAPYKHKAKLAKKRHLALPVRARIQDKEAEEKREISEVLADFSRVSARAMADLWGAPEEDVTWRPK